MKNYYFKKCSTLELTEEESRMAEQLRAVWKEILKIEITDETDFFETGAGSMDVVRLVEEVKDKSGISITNEDVFMATVFDAFIQTVTKVRQNKRIKIGIKILFS